MLNKVLLAHHAFHVVHNPWCGLLLHQLAIAVNVAQLAAVSVAPGVRTAITCGHSRVAQAGRHTHHVGQVEADWKACERHLKINQSLNKSEGSSHHHE